MPSFGSGGGNAILRARSAFARAGLGDAGPLERVANASNEVWYSGPYVMRMSTSPSTLRLHGEAALLCFLPRTTLQPGVVAWGKENLNEWIIVNRQEGVPLEQVWGSMNEATRRSLVHQLGNLLKELHGTEVPEATQWPTPTPSIVTQRVEHPHASSLLEMEQLLFYATSLPFVDKGVMDAAIDFAREKRSGFATDEHWLIHGDFHFENVLSDGERVTALIDFEWSTLGPRETDLSILLRFCALPQLHSPGERDGSRDYWSVPRWLREVYPEMFEHPDLENRLLIQSLAYDIRDLIRHPPKAPATDSSRFEPLNRIQSLIAGRNHLHLLQQ